MALVVEAGWAPWVADVEVVINNLYTMDSDLTNYSAQGAAHSLLCKGVNDASRSRRAFWVPWVKTLDQFNTNSRCSMGGVMALKYVRLRGAPASYRYDQFRRPLVVIELEANNLGLTLFLVHLVSSLSAPAELNHLITSMSRLIPAGTMGMIVGDMNIDATVTAKIVPAGWKLLRVNTPTQLAGRELDYGLLYDPRNALPGATASVLKRYKTDQNLSDHSVICYSL